MDYPEEWKELPKRERRKKIKQLKREKESKEELFIKVRNVVIVVVIAALVIVGYRYMIRKTPEEIAFEKEIEEISLDGRVEEYSIEGRNHILPGEDVSYDTNPPTSGSHLAQAENWGVYGKEIDDKAAVHGLEHGGIWISYKDIGDDEIAMLENIGKQNSQSVIVSPRSDNDVKIAVVSWGRMMKLESVDEALTQKYIDTYKNQSPEKIAR